MDISDSVKDKTMTIVTDKDSIFYKLNIVYPFGEEADPYYWSGAVTIYDCDGDQFYQENVRGEYVSDTFVKLIIRAKKQSFNEGLAVGKELKAKEIKGALYI